LSASILVALPFAPAPARPNVALACKTTALPGMAPHTPHTAPF